MIPTGQLSKQDKHPVFLSIARFKLPPKRKSICLPLLSFTTSLMSYFLSAPFQVISALIGVPSTCVVLALFGFIFSPGFAPISIRAL